MRRVSGYIGFRRLLSILGTLLCLVTPVSADEIEWLERSYDFGAFREAEGVKTGRVRFVNRGKEPTVINRVRLTCGCTSETHTEGLVAPGDTAVIEFSYNPKGRPGRFEKTIKVYVGEDPAPVVIGMKGTVIGAPQTLEADYPLEVGPLRINTRRSDFGKITHGSARHIFLTCYNQGNDTLRPVFRNLHEMIDVDITPKAVPPGDIATVSVYLNTREFEDMGPHEYQVDLFPFEGSTDKMTLTFAADIQPDMSRLSVKDVNDGPRIYCLPESVDIGTIGAGGKHQVRFSFVISNDGKSELEVLRIFNRDGAVKVTRYPARLRPGKSGKVECVAEVAKLPEGPFRIKVEVMSTDPLHPVRSVVVCGLRE